VPAKVTQLPAKKSATLRWAAPAGAIAAVLLLWVGMQQFQAHRAVREADSQIAENREQDKTAPAQPAPPQKTPESASQSAPRGAPLAEDRLKAAPATREADEANRPAARSLQISPQPGPSNAQAKQNQTQLSRSEAESFQAGAGTGSGADPALSKEKFKDADAKSDAAIAAGAGVAGGITASKPEAKPAQDRRDSLDTAEKKSAVNGRNYKALAVAAPPPPPPPSPSRPAGVTQLHGLVTDPSGAAVPGANVALKSANGSTVTQTATDNGGAYTFNGVVAGNYKLELQSPGFKSDTITGVNVAPGDNVQNAQLQIGAVTETVEVSAQAAVLNTQAAEVSSLPLRAGHVQALILASSGLQTVTSPDGKAIWKFGDTGQIFHSTNAGKNWSAQSSAVSAKLLAASAPSAKVCWIAGAAGTLLRTTDSGKHWSRIPIPITGDLGGVRASDDKRVTIWDAANQATFQTEDGGKNWTPTPKD
jgi:hypothetical protein